MASVLPASPESALRQYPRAADLSVSDGRTPLGRVIDCRRPERGAKPAPAFAFDTAGRLVGVFPTRREAVAALPGASR